MGCSPFKKWCSPWLLFHRWVAYSNTQLLAEKIFGSAKRMSPKKIILAMKNRFLGCSPFKKWCSPWLLFHRWVAYSNTQLLATKNLGSAKRMSPKKFILSIKNRFLGCLSFKKWCSPWLLFHRWEPFSNRQLSVPKKFGSAKRMSPKKILKLLKMCFWTFF